MTEVLVPTISSRPGPTHLELQADLEREVDAEIRFDASSRGAYSTDASNFRRVPIGVVVPRTTDALAKAVEVCARHDVPITNRGGGTSLAGQTCNVAVILDCSKYLRKIVEVDPDRRIAVVEPGVVLDQLRAAVRPLGLTFGPDPSTHDHCTLGGMIGNNSCGVHSVMAGRTSDNVEELEIVTYDGVRMRVGPTSDDELASVMADGGRRGQIYADLRSIRDRYGDRVRERYPDIPRRVSGYNLDELLPENGFHVARAVVGTEGTCATVLTATVRLVPDPPERTTLVLGYPDVYEAADHVMEVMESGPIGLEGIDEQLVTDIQEKRMHVSDLELLPDGQGWLLVEFGGDTKQEADAKARELIERLGDDGPSSRLYDDTQQSDRVWEIRESGLGATARIPAKPDAWPGWEDSAVPPERLGGYLRDLKQLYKSHDVDGALYGHFGQGCVHSRISFDLTTAGGIANYKDFLEEAADLVVSYGGSLSGEHGDGQQRAAYLPKMFGEELVQAFGEFKHAWDPGNRMNPGKVVHAARPDQHLRLGVDHRPREVKTTFSWPDDDGSFARATERCVGVGKCRRTDGGTMCPSYMVTLEEEHSTRGRARLLFEMMNGEEIDGWRSEAVKESLDLCLACKGCKSDCPVNVDMASYKAEFMSQHYKGRMRPRPAYAMGLIAWWTRAASKVPRLANALGSNRLLHRPLMRAAGLAHQRRVPRFARKTLVEQLAGPSGDAPSPRGQVILWPDTFTNHFHPDVGIAASEILQTLGWEVMVPSRLRCCGRPLYDYGMLHLAKRWLQAILDDLREEARAGTPIVVLEPSCLAVFRDELLAMFPHDLDAQRVADQCFSLGELLAHHVDDLDLPQTDGKVLLHPHCHQGAVVGTDCEQKVLEALGIEVEQTEAGCCGLAGSFGFEADKYDVSVAVAERKFLPKIKEAESDTMVMTDGFSCRTQLADLAGTESHHFAEIVRGALQRSGRLRR
jgi:FAD/FMN-containing dehydrogenase/Fe-S oxidoreductase